MSYDDMYLFANYLIIGGNALLASAYLLRAWVGEGR